MKMSKEISPFSDALDQLDQIYKTSPVGMCLVDTDLRYIRINQILAEINDVPIEKHIGKTISEVIPKLAPFIEPAFKEVLKTGKPIENIELQTTTPQSNSIVRDWIVNYYPYISSDGQILGVSVTVQEITEMKRALQANESAFLKGILQGQESERSRLARELHDAAAQNISALAIHVSALAEGSIENFKERAQELAALASETGDSVRRMALDLHPMELDLLGLTAALQQFSNTIQKNSAAKITIQIEGDNHEELMSPEALLTCYRVCQEAISNSVIHAQATLIEILIGWESSLLTLTVTDDGIGFDPETTGPKDLPMGIISMRERAKLADGSLLISSDSKTGTTLRLELPISDE